LSISPIKSKLLATAANAVRLLFFVAQFVESGDDIPKLPTGTLSRLAIFL
jgi:hypothetical protein